MESLLLGVKVILPLIVFMGLGYLFKSLHTAAEKTFRELNKICFRCFLPVMIFYNIIQSDLKQDFHAGILVYAVISVFAIFFLSFFLVQRSRVAFENRSVLIQGLYRSNFVLFGMEVTRTICGENQMGMASILVSVIIPIFNVLAVILFEMFGSERRDRKRLVLNILKNPLIIASIAGLLVKLAGFSFPKVILTTLGSISSLATPTALLCLGGTFAFLRMRHYRKELITACIGRLAVVPVIFIFLAVLFGVRGANLVALMVLYASPTAVSSFSMACEMKGNGELAGMIVVLTSVLSVLGIFLWVTALSGMGLL